MRSALLELLRSQGADISADPSGMSVDSFGDPDGEASAALTGCIVAQRSSLGRVVLRGKDHRDLLQRISTNEINGLEPGEGTLTVFLNPRGRILDLVHAVASEDQMLLITSAGNGKRIHEWIDSFVFREEVTLEDSSKDTLLGLYGPGAGPLLENLTGIANLEDLRTAWHLEAQLKQMRLRILRTFPLAGSGFFTLVDSQDAAPLWEALVRAGAFPAGEQALERLRVESGVPALGPELSEDQNPWEAALDQAISLTKGCYTGQEVLARLNTYKKVQRRLAGLVMDTDGLPHVGSPVFHGDRPIGKVTSSAPSPRDGKPLALALLTLPHPPLEARVEVDSGGARLAARTRALPFLS
jgi:folate-binding protein YgfZ